MGISFARVLLCNILESVNNTLPAQLFAPVETRLLVDDLDTNVVANGEDDVANTICSFALELRDELENEKPTLSKNESKIVSKRNCVAKRVQRILNVSDCHLPVAGAARDFGIVAAGGRRRRKV